MAAHSGGGAGVDTECTGSHLSAHMIDNAYIAIQRSLEGFLQRSRRSGGSFKSMRAERNGLPVAIALNLPIRNLLLCAVLLHLVEFKMKSIDCDVTLK